MSSINQHEIKAASAVLSDDVICQSFVQSSSTLAYACLLIRQKKYELATHVLHSLEAKQASRFKDMVFYLQMQIGIETGEYAVVKKRLMPRVNQQPNDLVALSLLEADIYLEWASLHSHDPVVTAGPVGPADPIIQAPVVAATNVEPAISAQGASKVNPFSPAKAPDPVDDSRFQPPSASDKFEAAPPSLFFVDEPPKVSPASAFVSAPGPVVPAGASDTLESEFGIYQGLAADDNTQALSLVNRMTGQSKSKCRNATLEPLMGMLLQLLPGAMAKACGALESGEIHKICFSFQHMTVTSLHEGAKQLALVTGNINQSLLTMVRAENIFQKQTKSAQAASAQARARIPSRPVEIP